MSYVTDEFDDEIVRLLQQGGVGLLPSDTIYGLSAKALDKQAVERVHKIKGRSSNKPFIVLISDIKMLDLLSISKNQAEPVKKYWPGALSVIFQAPGAPGWLQLGNRSLAVRLPKDARLRNLISRTGPLISTSANIEGAEQARTIDDAKLFFGSMLDFYVDLGPLNNLPSTLVGIQDHKFQIIRQGAVKIDEKELL